MLEKWGRMIRNQLMTFPPPCPQHFHTGQVKSNYSFTKKGGGLLKELHC